MKRKFKVGDWVIFTDKGLDDWWKKLHGVSLYGKLPKIIYIDKSDNTYLLEFKEYIKGHDGYTSAIKGKEGHCLWCDKDEFKSAISHLKFKKWIKS